MDAEAAEPAQLPGNEAVTVQQQQQQQQQEQQAGPLQEQEAPHADVQPPLDDTQQQQHQQLQQPQPQQQQHGSTTPSATASNLHQLQIFLKMVVQQQVLQPGICMRGDRGLATASKVADWGTVKKSRSTTSTKKDDKAQRERENARSRWAQQRAGVQKIAGTAGRTFTSRFRGVHQTFPTKRWEAQFRRNGKPTSLGCFDQEDEAARAYDRMMLWCEIHGAAGSMKGSVTNFDLTEYEKDIAWLTGITQDDLIEALRSEGRKQAMNRQAAALNAKRSNDLSRGARSGGQSDDPGLEATAEGVDMTTGPAGDYMDVEGGYGTAATTSAEAVYGTAAAAAATAAAAGAAASDGQAAAAGQDQDMQDVQQQQQGAPPMLSLPVNSPAANTMASPGAAVAAAALLASNTPVASPEALGLLFGHIAGGIGQDALAAVQQLQQQLDQAAATGAAADADAAAAAAFQIGQIAGTNLLAALSAGPSPAAGAAAMGAAVPMPFALAAGSGGSNEAMAAYGMDEATAAALAAVGGEDMTAGLQQGQEG